MSNQAITWAYKQDVKPAAAKFVLVTLANFADAHGVCYPSQKRLADDTGQDERSVRRHLADLQKAGFITRAHRQRPDGSRRSDVFYLNWAEDTSGTEAERQPDNMPARTIQPDNFAGVQPDKLPGHEPSQDLTITKKSYSPEFEVWWLAYPREPNMSKPKAFSAFKTALKDTPLSEITDGLAAYKQYLAAPDNAWQRPCHAATWLNQRRWEGFLEEPEPPPKPLSEDEKRAMRIAAGLEDAAA